MPRAEAAKGDGKATIAPSSVMVPLSGCTMPLMIFTSVDLPAPFSPISPWTRPAEKLSETLSRACVLPKRLLIPVRLSSAWVEAAAVKSATSRKDHLFGKDLAESVRG